MPGPLSLCLPSKLQVKLGWSEEDRAAKHLGILQAMSE